MSSPDYIPLPEGVFDGFQGNFVDYVVANLAGVLPPALIADLVAGRAEWESAYPAHTQAKAAARAAAQRKRAARRDLQNTIRSVSARLQADPSIEDSVRVVLGLTVRDRVRSRVAVPESAPLLITLRARGEAIELRIVDRETKSRRKPRGVVGCQVFVDVGGPTPEPDLDRYRYLGMATDGRIVANFSGADIGKFAHFYGRWVNTRGELGPLSATLSLIVPN